MNRFLLLLLLSAVLLPLSGQAVLDPVRVETVPEGITAARQERILLDCSFRKPDPAVKLSNYQDRVKFEYLVQNGISFLRIRQEEKKERDTAWGIAFPETDLPPAHFFDLRLKVRSSYPDTRLFPPQGYNNYLQFTDARGKVLLKIPLDFSGAEDHFRNTRLTGRIPAGAVKCRLTLGADAPNLKYGEFIDFGSVRLAVWSKDAPRYKDGSFTSRFYPLDGGTFSWEGKGRILPRLSFAPDDGGRPGAWGAWTGPLRKPVDLSAADKNCRWVRYQVRLEEGALLKKVRIGKYEDSGWATVFEDRRPEISLLSGTPVTDPAASVVLKISGRSGVDRTTLKISLDGKKVFAETEERKNSLTLTLRPELPLKPGVHKIEISVRDFSGQERKRELYVFAGSRAEKGIVSIRKDGVTLIDGKPFFPIGLCSVQKQKFNEFNFDKAFRDMKAGGFNTAHTYAVTRNADFQEFLDTADKYGFKVIVPGRGGANEKRIGFILTDLVKEYRHPALMAWYIGDDTASFNTPDELADRTEAVKAVAPHLLTAQADEGVKGDRSRFLPFAHAQDVFLPEIYPVRKPGEEMTENCAAYAIQDAAVWYKNCRSERAKNKACWAIIQYFKGYNFNRWVRFPSMKELRAMTWGSVIHGARGVLFYTYGGTPPRSYGCWVTPENWNTVCTMARELRDLAPVLCAEGGFHPVPEILSGPRLDVLKQPSVTALCKEYGGKKWLFAVNSAGKPVRVRFRLQDVSRGTVLGENRFVTLKNGTFEETFDPQGVHIYRWEK